MVGINYIHVEIEPFLDQFYVYLHMYTKKSAPDNVSKGVNL